MRLRINSPKVIHQIFETEVVVVNLDSGIYYSVGGSGIAIWRALGAGLSRDEIIGAFHGDAAERVSNFLDQLAREELIVNSETGEASRGSIAAQNGSFVAPTLERYDDMRDLLLLDPIHELDESGWPRNLPGT